MKVLILLSFLALAAARPEAGYSYNRPQQSHHNSVSNNYNNNNGYNQAAQTETVHKHIYVHVAPEEEDDYANRQPAPVAPAQVHYKIIFIKAPSYGNSAAQQLALLSQAPEEKTLVYVLSKKPEEIDYNQQANQAQFTPSKPEVFFIKYKAQQEAGGGSAQDSYGPPPQVQAPAPVYGPVH